MQDDRMLGTLTVREHLGYVARLRLPSYLTYEQKMARVDEVLEELSISHISDSMIGTSTSRGISGGEKRRLSIATELITDPPILFLDEPTSGLDAYTAYSLVETLRKLAHDKGRTIVVSIHQPRSNIYYLFDSLMLLAYGEVIYYGLAKEALTYFSSLHHDCPPNYNPADYFIDLVQMVNILTNPPFKLIYIYRIHRMLFKN
jgi:ABC-type multidrug transport system ATPase subunit